MQEAPPSAQADILDHSDMVTSGDLIDRIHLRALPEQVNRNDRLGLVRHRRLNQLGIKVEGLWVDVDEDGLGTHPPDGPGRGKEREGGEDHFVALPDLHRHHRTD
jgi:hypothetical protein